jgi:hexokinase
LAAVLTDFAKKYPMLKVLKIPGDQCIEGYPDRLMPTILVYGPNHFRSQVVGLVDLGGNNTRISGVSFHGSAYLDLERYAEKIGALTKVELRVSSDKEVEEGGQRGMWRSTVNQNDDDDDDWD